jgi:hypothetical protein
MQQPLLPGVDRKQIVQSVAIVMAIVGVLSILTGLPVIFGGALIANAFVTIGGILLLVNGVASLAVAYGLFTRQPWARMGTVGVAVIGVVAEVVWLLAGFGGISAIAQGIFYGFVAYFFYFDAEVKAYLGGT